LKRQAIGALAFQRLAGTGMNEGLAAWVQKPSLLAVRLNAYGQYQIGPTLMQPHQ
jgi:hypothetical protein